MKSESRGWLVGIIILLTWRMTYTSPFSYFADMIVDGIKTLVEFLRVPPQPAVLLLYFMVSAITCGLLFLGRKQFRLYLAGFFVLAVLAHHLVICIRQEKLFDVSLPIVIVLALALVFLLIRNKTPGLFLADAFIMALPVWLIYDGLLVLLFSLFKWSSNRWSPLFVLPDNPQIHQLDGLLHMPWQIWTVFPVVLAVAPIIILSKNRNK
jgi:hypothetical protein